MNLSTEIVGAVLMIRLLAQDPIAFRMLALEPGDPPSPVPRLSIVRACELAEAYADAHHALGADEEWIATEVRYFPIGYGIDRARWIDLQVWLVTLVKGSQGMLDNKHTVRLTIDRSGAVSPRP